MSGPSEATLLLRFGSVIAAGGVTDAVFEIGVAGPELGKTPKLKRTDDVAGKSTSALSEPLPKGRNFKATFRAVQAADSCRQGSGKRAVQSLASDVLRF